MSKKTYTFDFCLEAWIRNVKIQANSQEEAEEKLYKMTVEDLIEEGYVDSSDLKEVGVEISD